MSAAGDYGAVMAALLAAHDLADHVVQTDPQAAGKAAEHEWQAAMAGHVGSYTAVQVGALLALRRYGVRPPWWRLAAGVAFSAATHALLDRRWPVKWILEHTGSAGFAKGTFLAPSPGLMTKPQLALVLAPAGPVPLHGPYLADQSLHHACLAIAAAIIVGRS